jgi:hypothetical protein
MNYHIFRIQSTPSSTNAYTTGRTETWTIVPDKTFTDLEHAKNYVITQNLIHSELARFLIDLNNEEEKDALKLEFCFGDDYVHLQRYFLGLPNVNKIRESLEAAGVTTI